MHTLVQEGTGLKKEFRKRYRVAPDLKNYLDEVMIRCIHPHAIVKEDGEYWCYTNDSGDVFHRLVKRARCEKESDEKGVCYMTYAEYMDYSYRTAFLEFIEDNAHRMVVAKDHAMLKAEF